MAYPNGTRAEYTYDLLNRLTLLENRGSDGSLISSYSYTLDAAGNRTRVEEEPSGRVVDYVYDSTDRLLSESITEPGKEDRITSYSYDKVGNRLSKTENGFTTTYVYDKNNRLIKEDDIIYRYDDNGNLIGKESAEEQIVYAYDYDNHLTRVETSRYGATIVVEYEYDANGNRVKKIIDGTITTSYLVDENREYAQVLEERDGDGNLLVRYVYGHDLISQTRPSAGSGSVTSYYHYDGLGSTRALSSSAGIVTDEYVYDAFGNLLDKSGVTVNTHLYTGEFFDSHLGFYYLRARYMNPAIGRFVTMDEFAGNSQDPYSLHKYLYANANPIMYRDPSGYMADLTAVGQKVASAMEGMLSRISVAVLNISPKQVVVRGLYGGIKGGIHAMMSGESILDGFVRGAISGAAFGALIKNFHVWNIAHSMWGYGPGNVDFRKQYPEYNIVEQHVHTFDIDELNEGMLQRLRNGHTEEADVSFYEHELLEAKLMEKGIPYEEAHEMALRDLGHNRWQIYHPDIVTQVDDIEGVRTMNSAYYEYWGID